MEGGREERRYEEMGMVTGVVGSDIETIFGLVAAVDDFGLQVVPIRWCSRAGRSGCLRLWHCGHEGEETEGGSK